jgi:hypothetical protein
LNSLYAELDESGISTTIKGTLLLKAVRRNSPASRQTIASHA